MESAPAAVYDWDDAVVQQLVDNEVDDDSSSSSGGGGSLDGEQQRAAKLIASGADWLLIERNDLRCTMCGNTHARCLARLFAPDDGAECRFDVWAMCLACVEPRIVCFKRLFAVPLSLVRMRVSGAAAPLLASSDPLDVLTLKIEQMPLECFVCPIVSI